MDPATGEVVPKCPGCLERDEEIRALKTEKRGWQTRYFNLARDSEATAKDHNLFPDAHELFAYWQDKTGHRKARFTADRFWLLEPFLRNEGLEECKRAIDGCVASDWHMKRNEYEQRDGAKHDRIEQIFGSQGKFERFRDDAMDRMTRFLATGLEDYIGERLSGERIAADIYA